MGHTPQSSRGGRGHTLAFPGHPGHVHRPGHAATPSPYGHRVKTREGPVALPHQNPLDVTGLLPLPFPPRWEEASRDTGCLYQQKIGPFKN